MKTKHIFSFFFSLWGFWFFAQDAETAQPEKWKYEPNFMVGADVLNAGVSFFSDRQLFQGFVSSRIRKDLHAAADAGYEKNSYIKNGYDARAAGAFIKLGVLYRLMKDPENIQNGFFAGGKLGASFYEQEYFAVPIRGFGGSNSFQAFPASTQSSYWLEGHLGGRVQLFSSNFYIDVSVQPRYLMLTTKQEEIYPMIVPGFGKSSGKFNMGYMWNIAYEF
ncbi:DUF6048 family protein [Chryseobacterium sp. MFBS3-17]|uniref:DUF6048 family protein n=1 Tax=Chryseobacterium sp. MFBS3-17 TaxID=2886689 RepID=UPI001D0DD840|nr:DUF6048 family protein [Chryseobacterium sp. MFBS3-17]MCC2589743.1 DUF6048 family protein [Chryseobacterium sp. MFBS3-17]